MILLLPVLAAAPPAEERRFALLVSNHEGFDGTVALRYVTEDVRKTREVLERQGGYNRLDIYEVERATPDYLALKIRELGYRIQSLQERGVRVSLYVYYSGHADAEQIQLGERGLPWGDLKRWLEAAGADSNLLVVDACGSGGLFTAKGLESRPGPLPLVPDAMADSDFAIVTSATWDQSARESRELQSSLFTHFFTHGHWGDADQDHDGLVTVAESFGYASGWVDRWARMRGLGPQEPQLRAPDPRMVVADLTQGAESELVLAAGEPGTYKIYDARTGALVLPVEMGRDAVRLALGPGRYLVHREAAYGAARAVVALGAGESQTVHRDDFELGWEEDLLKGWAMKARARVRVLDVSVHGLAGVSTWADTDVREGYFPTSGQAGLQARVAWPSGLYWSGDVWGGLGSGQVQARTEGGWEEQSFRTWHTRSGGVGLGAGAMTRGPFLRVGGGLHLQGYSLDRRLSDGDWAAADGDPDTAPLLILAPGLDGFLGLRDGRAEIELHFRSHYLPYVIEPEGGRRDNVGTTEALLTLGWRL